MFSSEQEVRTCVRYFRLSVKNYLAHTPSEYMFCSLGPTYCDSKLEATCAATTKQRTGGRGDADRTFLVWDK